MTVLPSGDAAMSRNRTPAEPPVMVACANEPLGWRLKTLPFSVTNHRRVSDWYSTALMFSVVPLSTAVQMPAFAAGGAGGGGKAAGGEGAGGARAPQHGGA